MGTTAGTGFGGGMEIDSVPLLGPSLILPLGTRARMSAASRFVGMTVCTFELSFQTREKEETKQTNQTTKFDQKTAHTHSTSTLPGPSFVRTFHMSPRSSEFQINAPPEFHRTQFPHAPRVQQPRSPRERNTTTKLSWPAVHHTKGIEQRSNSAPPRSSA